MQTNRHRCEQSQTCRQAYRQTDRGADKQRYRQTAIGVYRQTVISADRQTNKGAKRERQAYRHQTDSQACKQTEILMQKRERKG